MRLYIHIQLQHHFRGKIGHFFNIVSERTLYSERIPVFIWSCPVLFFEFYQIFHEAAWRRGGGPQYLSKSFFFFPFLLFSKAFGNFSSPALAVYWSARAHAEAQSEGSAAVCNTRQSSLNLSKWSSGRGRPGKMVQKGSVYVFRLCVCVCAGGGSLRTPLDTPLLPSMNVKLSSSGRLQAQMNLLISLIQISPRCSVKYKNHNQQMLRSVKLLLHAPEVALALPGGRGLS